MEQVIEFISNINITELFATIGVWLTVIITAFVGIAEAIKKLENEKATRKVQKVLDILYALERGLEVLGVAINKIKESKDKVEEAKKIKEKRKEKEIEDISNNQ